MTSSVLSLLCRRRRSTKNCSQLPSATIMWSSSTNETQPPALAQPLEGATTGENTLSTVRSVPVRPLESAIIKHKAQEYQLDKQDITFLHTARALFTMGHVCICFLPTQPRSPITVSSLPFQPRCRPKIPLKMSRGIFCTTST